MLVACASAPALRSSEPAVATPLVYRVGLSAPRELQVDVEAGDGSPLVGRWRFRRWRGHVSDLIAGGPNGDQALELAGEGTLTLPAGTRWLRYRYSVPLGWSLRSGAGGPSGFVLDGQAYLLRPATLPAKTPVRVRFSDPAPLVPWPLRNGTAILNGRDLWDPGFHTFGGQRFAVSGGDLSLEVTVLGEGPSRDALQAWLTSSAEEVDAVSPLGPRRIALTVVVQPGGAGVPFGQVLRSHPPSMAIYVGSRSTPATLARDWVAVHELSHLVHPRIQPGCSWLSEGLASYFQEIARARSGRLSAADAWAHLARGIRRGRREAGQGTLESLSERMHELHCYRAVYWGGAALAFDLDLELRRRGTSLEALLLAFGPQGPPRTQEAFAQAVDAHVGRPLWGEIAARHLSGPALGGSALLLRRAGIDPESGALVPGADAALREQVVSRRKFGK